MKVLVACEFSGTVRDAFIARGHDAMSCDLLPTEKPGPHYQGDIFDVLYNHWDLMIAHPPCTYLTNAGVRHLMAIPSKNGKIADCAGVPRWRAMHEAGRFFRALQQASIERICIENPIPHGFARDIIGDYSQIIQPWQFGHGETKATCLWLKNLPPLMATKLVTGRTARIHNMSPSADRWKLRSMTYQGIADAMADQWGSL